MLNKEGFSECWVVLSHLYTILEIEMGMGMGNDGNHASCQKGMKYLVEYPPLKVIL